MRYFLIFLSVILIIGINDLFAQIYAPEGLNMPGAYDVSNSIWNNPPSVNVLAGAIKTGGLFLPDNGLATPRYKTTINVQASGGDIIPGTYDWKFSSGPTSNYWTNQWGSVTVVPDSIQLYTYGSSNNHTEPANNNVTVGSGYYTVIFHDNGYVSDSAIWMKTSSAPRTITGVTGIPSVAGSNSTIPITVSFDGQLSPEEYAYIRYSTDNFATAANTGVVQVTNISGSGSSYSGTAIIPGQITSGTTVTFYVLTTTIPSNKWYQHNNDLLTLNYKNNNKENYSYTIVPVTSIAAGNWSSASTWNTGIVPPANASVKINNSVTLDVDATVSAITVSSAGALNFGAGKLLAVAADGALTNAGTVGLGSGILKFSGVGTLTNTGTINFGADSVIFAGAATISNSGTLSDASGSFTFASAGTVTGSVSFYNLNIAGGLSLGTAAAVGGTFRINTNGYLASNPVTYNPGSTLQYNTGGTYGRGNEWSSSAIPAKVLISNNTTVDLGANSGTTTAQQIAGPLTIDAGSALTMNNTGNQMTTALTVNDTVTNNGTIILSGSIGGDLILKGNFINNGTLNVNGRSIQFGGSSQQKISGTGTTSIDYLEVNNAAGISLSQDVTVPTQLVLTNGLITLGGNNLILGSGASVSGTPSVTKMVLTTGAGQLRKLLPGNGSFTFPVGNSGATPVYSPVTVNLTNGNYGSGSYVGVTLTAAKHPQNASSANYLTRYWTLSTNAISNLKANVTANYAASDVQGTEANIIGGLYANGYWTPLNSVTTSSHSLSATINSPGDLTGGEPTALNAVAYTTVASGGWKTAANWINSSVPPSGARIVIANDMTLDTNAIVASLTVNSGKTFTASDASARLLTIAPGDSILNSGAFLPGNGTVTFAGTALINGAVTFNNVNISSNGVNFGSASTINGVLSLNAGGYIDTNPPSYATGSTLKYNAGSVYGRYLEWSDTTGRGYPYNVQISNGTKLDLGNGGTDVARRIAGSLTIDALGTLTADSASNKMTAPLTILGSVTNNGRLVLSSAGVGPDLHVGGNFTNNGLFAPNTREVVFDGSTAQTINVGANALTTLDYVAVGNANGVTLGSVAGNILTVNQRLRFTADAGNLTTGADTLVFGSSGTISGESASHEVVGSLKLTKPVGTSADTLGGIGVAFDAGSVDIGDITVTRLTGTTGAVTYNGKTGINRSWKISSSRVDTVNRTMTFSWLSSEDNGKAVTKTKVFYSSNNGTSWYGASGIYQDASGSRSVSAQIMRLGRFTISDSINALEITSYPLQVTALSQGLWNGSVTVQDTFTVELHAGTSPYGLAATGKVLSTTAGVLAMTLSGVTNDVSYYVVIKGRNVLETWSASPVALSAGGTAYDFTTAANQAYGSNQILKGGKYCLYAGDVDQSGAIDTTDLRLIDQDAVKYTSLDYVGQYATDLDGNKFVDSDDLLLCDNNVYNSVAVSRPPVIVNPPSTKAARPGLQNQTKEKKSNQ